MRGLVQLDRRGVTTAACRARVPQLYQRYGAAIYGQALLILKEKSLAERVVGDVIVAESARPPASSESERDAAGRLAVSVLWRCRDLTANPIPADRAPADLTPADTLLRREREALSLVLYGGLDYRQVGHELAIPAREAAMLLREALTSLGASAARS